MFLLLFGKSIVFGITTGLLIILSTFQLIKLAGKFNEFRTLVNRAIKQVPDETQYRYKYASFVFDYCTGNNTLSRENRKMLYEDAKKELLISENNYISRLNCLELLSLIELEQGNRENAFTLKDEIFKIDTCRFSYRNNLAMYYLRNNEDSSAIKELSVILKYDPKSVEANTAYEIYLERGKKYNEAFYVCRLILEVNPENQFARNSITRLSSLLKEGN